LHIINHHLYIKDFQNNRFVEVDLDFENEKYYMLYSTEIKPNRLKNMPFTILAMDDRYFLGVCIHSRFEAENLLYIINRQMEVEKSFFNYLPVPMDSKRNISLLRLNVKVGISHSQKRFLVTFETPANQIEFFLYNFSGELLKRFYYKQDDLFQFPDVFPPPANKKINITIIANILANKDYFLVFLEQGKDFCDSPDYENNDLCLIYSTKGDFVKAYNVREELSPLYFSDDGYLLAKTIDNDYDQLTIYKLDL